MTTMPSKWTLLYFLRKNSIIVIWQSFRYGFEPSNSWLHRLSFWQTPWIWIRQYWKLLYWKLYPLDKFKKQEVCNFHLLIWIFWSYITFSSQTPLILFADWLFATCPCQTSWFCKGWTAGGYERRCLIETT